MSEEAMTPEQIREAGLNALERELGLVGTIRFLQQFDAGKGDYTAERHQWLQGVTVKAIVADIERQCGQ